MASPAAAVLERRQRSGPHAHRPRDTTKRSFEITNQHHLLLFTITMHARRSARAFHSDVVGSIFRFHDSANRAREIKTVPDTTLFFTNNF